MSAMLQRLSDEKETNRLGEEQRLVAKPELGNLSATIASRC